MTAYNRINGTVGGIIWKTWKPNHHHETGGPEDV